MAKKEYDRIYTALTCSRIGYELNGETEDAVGAPSGATIFKGSKSTPFNNTIVEKREDDPIEVARSFDSERVYIYNQVKFNMMNDFMQRTNIFYSFDPDQNLRDGKAYLSHDCVLLLDEDRNIYTDQKKVSVITTTDTKIDFESVLNAASGATHLIIPTEDYDVDGLVRLIDDEEHVGVCASIIFTGKTDVDVSTGGKRGKPKRKLEMPSKKKPRKLGYLDSIRPNSIQKAGKINKMILSLYKDSRKKLEQSQGSELKSNIKEMVFDNKLIRQSLLVCNSEDSDDITVNPKALFLLLNVDKKEQRKTIIDVLLNNCRYMLYMIGFIEEPNDDSVVISNYILGDEDMDDSIDLHDWYTASGRSGRKRRKQIDMILNRSFVTLKTYHALCNHNDSRKSVERLWKRLTNLTRNEDYLEYMVESMDYNMDKRYMYKF